MFVPPNRAPRYLNALANGIIDSSVRDDDVASFRKCRYDARDGGKSLGIDYARGRAQMCRYVCFGLDVYILCAVKPWRATRPHSVGTKDLNGFLFQSFIADEIVKVVGSKVCDCTAVG